MAKFEISFRDHPSIDVVADHYTTNGEAAVFRNNKPGEHKHGTVAYVPMHNVLAILTTSGEVEGP